MGQNSHAPDDFGLLQSVAGTVGNIYTSIGRTGWLLRWGIFASMVNLAAFMVGKNWGSTGVALAYAFSTAAVLLYPNFAIPFRLIHLSVRRFALALLPVFAMAGVMGACVVLALSFVPDGVHSWVNLTVGVTTGVMIYGMLMLKFKPAGYRDLLPMFAKLLGR